MSVMAADPKPEQRIIDRPVMKRALLAHRECSCGEPASDPHHVVYRSEGGDDVVENIRPLCHWCHMQFHQGDAEAIHEVGRGLLPQNIEYVLTKKGLSPGVEYLRRRYALMISYRDARALRQESCNRFLARLDEEGE